MSIEFTNGFTIVPNNSIPPGGHGGYYLVNDYRPANNNGEIIIPPHTGGDPLDFNSVNENTGNAIYINKYDSNGTDNSAYLYQLVGNHTHLTFSQNNYHVTFDCDATAWENTNYGGQVYHDPSFEGAPQNSISIISTSGQAFNDVDEIIITIEVI